MNATALLAAALLVAQDVAHDPARDPAAGAAAAALDLEREVMARDDSLDVALVSQPGEPELLDVVSHGAPAHVVLARMAQALGRELRIDAGEAALRAATALDVHLRRRPARDALHWVAGAAGLNGEIQRAFVRVRADASQGVTPDDALARAIDGWRIALLRDPLQPDGPRLRFQIGNALYQLGEYRDAIATWKDLESSAPGFRTGGGATAGGEFGDLALVFFRCGHAYANLGDEAGAQEQWLKIAQSFPGSPLVASARLEAVKSFRRQGDHANAQLLLREVVERMTGLAPEQLIDAGELLIEAQSHERAAQALRRAIHSTSDPRLEERGMVALARSCAGQRDWHGVIATAQECCRRHGDGEHVADVWRLLGEAHFELADPFTALLAVRRVRELEPREELAVATDLLEGRIWASVGLLASAEPCLGRVAESPYPRLAAPALALHARLLLEAGQFEAAARTCERLRRIAGHEVEAAVELARIYLRQRNRARCLALVRETLPLADEAQREALAGVAREALRDAPADAAWADAVGATPAAAPSPESTEPTDGRR